MVKINGDTSSTTALSLERALAESENRFRSLFKNADFHPLSITDEAQFYVAIAGDVTMTARRGFCGGWKFQTHCW